VAEPGQTGVLAHVSPVTFDPSAQRPPGADLASGATGEASDASRDARAPRPAGEKPRRKHKKLRWVMLVLAVVIIAGGTATGLMLAQQRTDLFNHVVPKLQSLPLAAAENAARHAGLEARATSSVWDVKGHAGVVIGQSIPPGRHERLHTVIGLEVSKGIEPVAVPSLANDSWVKAERALTAARLGHGLVHLFSTTIPINTVITWTHKGAKVPPGTIIQITVSEGPPPRKVPYVPRKDDWAQASALLTAAGFVPQQLTAFSTTISKGAIISVFPNYSNGPEPYHTTVHVTFSKGPQYFQIPNDIVGMSLGQARAELEKYFVVKVYGSGTVLFVRPGAGSSEQQGSTVYLFAL
jgi:beta-lactam-binding protein with PASTA domain